MSSSRPNPIVDVLCDFFEVTFHNILHSRKVYPETIFESKRKFGVVVHQSRHPDVNAYISESLKAVNFHLRKKQLDAIYLCIHSGGRPIEKFTFEILSLNLNCTLESDPFLVKFEQELRDFCLKLNAADGYLEELSDDASFSIQLNISEYSSEEFNQQPAYENFPWINLTESETTVRAAEIVPLRTITVDFATVQMFIEKTGSD